MWQHFEIYSAHSPFCSNLVYIGTLSWDWWYWSLLYLVTVAVILGFPHFDSRRVYLFVVWCLFLCYNLANCTNCMLSFIFMVPLSICISLNFACILQPFLSISVPFQMEVELDKEVMALSENHPYIAMVVGGASLQAFLTAEHHVLEPLKKRHNNPWFQFTLPLTVVP